MLFVLDFSFRIVPRIAWLWNHFQESSLPILHSITFSMSSRLEMCFFIYWSLHYLYRRTRNGMREDTGFPGFIQWWFNQAHLLRLCKRSWHRCHKKVCWNWIISSFALRRKTFGAAFWLGQNTKQEFLNRLLTGQRRSGCASVSIFLVGWWITFDCFSLIAKYLPKKLSQQELSRLNWL